MKGELREKLGLSRSSTSSYFSPAEHELIENDRELQDELCLNDALRQIERNEWRKPPKALLVGRAIRSLNKRRRETYFSRMLRRITDRFPLTPSQLVYRTSLLVLGLLLGMVLINNLGRLITGRGAAPAADAQQIYVLTYDINVPEDTGRHAGAPVHGSRGLDLVCREMRGIYQDWSSRHPEFSEAAAREAIISFSELWQTEPDQSGDAAQVQIELSLGMQTISQSLLDELVMIFDAVPEVNSCIIRRYIRESEEVLLSGELTGGVRPVTPEPGEDSADDE